MKNSGFSISPSCVNCRRSDRWDEHYFCRKRQEQYKMSDIEKKVCEHWDISRTTLKVAINRFNES